MADNTLYSLILTTIDTYRYFRLVLTTNVNNYTLSIYEVQFYGREDV